MTSSPNLDAIRLVLDLIAAPLVLEVLDGLDRKCTPQQTVPPGTDPAVVEAAIGFLRGVDAIAPAPQADLAVTPRGHRLLAALREVGETDRAPDSCPNS